MMMRVYLRIGKGRNGYKAAAGMKRSPAPLTEARGGVQWAIPTLQIRLNLKLSPTAFEPAEIEIPIEDVQTEVLSAEVEG